MLLTKLALVGVPVLLGVLWGVTPDNRTGRRSPSMAGEVEPGTLPAATDPDGPRKVVVGTGIFSLPRPFTTLDARLAEIGEFIDALAADAAERHGRGLDLAVLTESALTHGRPGDLLEQAVPLQGEVESYFAAKAREHNTYIVLCFAMLEKDDEPFVSNAAVLFDRDGSVAGIYRKVFLAPRADTMLLEGGKRPGTGFPVFDCDFGRIGMQICYDVGFDEGMQALADQGAELIAWPTASPQTTMPSAYAQRFGYYIVSATRRNNAAVIDPLGEIAAQVLPPERVLTHLLDLDYRIVHWQPTLRNGEALRDAYGDRVGFRYSERQDYGIFWSNDPDLPIARMLEEQNLLTDDQLRQLARQLREQALAPVSSAQR